MTANLRHWTINRRLQLVTAMALMMLIGLLGVALVIQTRDMRDARLSQLTSIVQSAASIAEHFQQEEAAGRMTTKQAQDAAAAAIRAIRYQGLEYIFITDMTPRMVMHPFKPEMEGQALGQFKDPAGFALFNAMVDAVRQRGDGTVRYLWLRPGAQAPVPKTSYVKGFAPWGWVIGTGVYIDDLQVMQHRLELRLIGVGLLITVMLGGTVWHIGRGISRPIVALTAATNRLADGELDTPIPGTDRHDELGMMSKTLAVLRDAAVARRQLEQQAAEQRVAKDRRQSAIEHHTQE
ncbi:MAG TPA: cache domain-containing protein, partial [Rhodopila sp.]|nr:cache domain-containing protein [Rhodopila sp.]